MASFPADILCLPIAHRGFHDAAAGVAENSRASFEAAVKGDYCIELDLQLSHDGEAMVFHDYDMTRLTGEHGPIQMRSTAELQKLKLLVGGETIPTLPEVLELVAGRVPLVIELKDQDGALGPNIGKMEARVGELMMKYKGPAVVMSFNPHSVIALSKMAPSVPRGLTTGDLHRETWPMLPRARAEEVAQILEYDTAKCSFISHRWQTLDVEPVRKLKKRGVPVLSWTIKSPEEEATARIIADNVTFEGYTPVT